MQEEVIWKIYSFEELSAAMLYDILYLRSKIFVVEQSDIYLDADMKDQLATHLVGVVDGRVVAYSRTFGKGVYWEGVASLGRIVVAQEYRKYGLGKDLMKKTLEILHGEETIQISAQLYLQRFYESFGFVADGQPYLEGSIKHIKMILMK